MKLFGDSYLNRRVLVTGHTGFKGSWLALWLQELGAHVTGIALAPDTSPSHWSLLDLDNRHIDSREIDIRDAAALTTALHEAEPEIIFHLAAQPLVRRSYRDPVDTWSTNVMGTVNVMEASRRLPSLHAIVAVTTDKCYLNREWNRGYRETDPLGGHDPYSASKAAAELVAASYRNAFFHASGPLLATARAGNVIGGGDWSEDRLIPDLVRATAVGEALVIRSPHATRPWQHVLESLAGYLLLGQKLLEERQEFADAWNFGPDINGNRPVEDVLARLRTHWPGLAWQVDTAPQPHEATLLHLDSSRARQQLGWKPVWPLDDCLAATATWYREWLDHRQVASRAQLARYVADAATIGAEWVQP